jgi:hypothetical protein
MQLSGQRIERCLPALRPSLYDGECGRGLLGDALELAVRRLCGAACVRARKQHRRFDGRR